MNLYEIAALSLPDSLTNNPILAAKIFARVSINPESQCWEWSGRINRAGYGVISHRKSAYLIHRLVYEETLGAIKAGEALDHLCRNRSCVNPQHLEPVTTAENNRRKTSFQWPHRSNPFVKGHVYQKCLHGHEITEANTLTRKDGTRRCRACEKARNQARYHTHPERLKLYLQKRFAGDPDGLRQYRNNKRRRWMARHPDKDAEYQQRYRLCRKTHVQA